MWFQKGTEYLRRIKQTNKQTKPPKIKQNKSDDSGLLDAKYSLVDLGSSVTILQKAVTVVIVSFFI